MHPANILKAITDEVPPYRAREQKLVYLVLIKPPKCQFMNDSYSSKRMAFLKAFAHVFNMIGHFSLKTITVHQLGDIRK